MPGTESRKKDRGILYSGPMVRALLAREKTQTRRVFKLSPEFTWDEDCGGEENGFVADGETGCVYHIEELICPYGERGDRLWVREATWIWCQKTLDGKTESGRQKFRYVPAGQHAVYCADQPKPTAPLDTEPNRCWRYKSGRYMPRWACRLILEITNVRVEKLQDISEADIRAEGIAEYARSMKLSDRLMFAWIHLWEVINGARDDGAYGWHRNPWVYVLTFLVFDRRRDHV